MQFVAKFFDGQTSRSHNVTVVVDNNEQLTLHGLDKIRVYSWSETKVSSQLGSTPRSLYFQDGAKCETSAHDVINALLRKSNKARGSRALHKLESKLKYVLSATLLVIAFTGFMVFYGIPKLAEKVAYSIPPSVDAYLAQGSMDILDKLYMDPSELSEETKLRLSKKFHAMAHLTNDAHNFELLFRSSPLLGANAFALPSGTIVVTDDLVQLAENDFEIMSIFAHEIGHVVHRHSMRSVLQNSAILLVLTAVTGDVFSSSAFTAALPLLLIQTKFSREFEVEADRYSYEYLVSNNIETHHFANILIRITGGESDVENKLKYISTHPLTKDRIELFTGGEEVSVDTHKLQNNPINN